MAERYYDLNGRENCTTAVISIADKSFRISRVVIAVRATYSNLLIEMGEMLKKLSAYDEEEDRDGKNGDRLRAEAESFSERKMEAYEKLLTLLLEKNGYSFDKEWWDDNTDEIDRRTFIESCLTKDSSGSDKKKGLPPIGGR